MIGIHIQDEHGVVEAELEDDEIVHLLIRRAAPETKCLQFIDPYGDTIFNRHQAAILADEIAALVSDLPDAAAQERARRLSVFARRVAESIHTYIKFIGE